MIPPKSFDWAKDWKSVSFDATITIVGISRGRSAANFNARSVVGNDYYTIFLTDLLDMLVNGDVKNNIISGEFIVKKRGRNFGIKLKNTPGRKCRVAWERDSNFPIPGYI